MWAEEIIPVVDLKDEIIGYKKRSDITTDDIYRVSSCRVKNSKGDVLLWQRALTKSHNPGVWSPLVNGTVTKWETYLDNIIKEAEEEAWLQLTKDDFISQKKYYSGSYWKKFVMYHVYVWNGDIKDLHLDPQEIMQVAWYSYEELRNDVEKFPEKYFSTLIRCLDNL